MPIVGSGVRRLAFQCWYEGRSGAESKAIMTAARIVNKRWKGKEKIPNRKERPAA